MSGTINVAHCGSSGILYKLNRRFTTERSKSWKRIQQRLLTFQYCENDVLYSSYLVANLFLNGPNPASFCLFSFFSQYNDKYSTNLTINEIRAQMVCLGFEPGAAGQQAQTDPLSQSYKCFRIAIYGSTASRTYQKIAQFGMTLPRVVICYHKASVYKIGTLACSATDVPITVVLLNAPCPQFALINIYKKLS